ncbi:ribonuclease P protein component [Deinobacterium chartae]|uniref:Ribonuclease P protein component n=1 Tax=Deinobacterium chartae TaxID=521158 RepID=A0A841I404_9DEIO|nr:ribonuclease P protein component [Deinobacterium chartae]MBB6099118.1 ribonuclease P protein component [Deinobacterium chartae]
MTQRGMTSLKGDAEFRRVRKGPAVRTPFFVLRSLPYRPRHGQPYRPQPVVGIVVSRKSLNKAVERNRARRRVREALRSISLPPCRAMLVLNPSVLEADFAELRRSLEGAFERVSRR